jgi:DNA-binding winged helix-turn-helix (wHTH) protein/tetratricopeptide (TPR) repeat protein
MNPSEIYEFGPFRLDVGNRILRRGTVPIPLSPKAFQTLLVLVQGAGRTVDKDELLKAVWPDTYTVESNMAHQVLAIRKALGDFSNGKQYIETISGRGYRFVGAINVAAAAPPVVEKPAIEGPDTQTAELPHEQATRRARVLFFLPPFKVLVPLFFMIAFIAAAMVFQFRGFRTETRGRVRLTEIQKEAQRNYDEGRFFWLKRTETGYRTAISHFDEAVRLDPNYAEAYAGLADSYILLGSFGVEPLGEAIPKARATALRAVELNEHSAEAHAALGYIMSRFDWNWDEAEREFKRAIELNPADTTAHHWYALHLITMGRAQEAISQMRTAQKLDPHSSVLRTDTALVLFYARRYDEAVEEVNRVIKAEPSFGLAHRTLGVIYAGKGRYREAIAELSQAGRLLGTDPWTVAETGRCYALLGERARALAKLDELKDLASRRFVSPSALALLSASLDDKRDESFGWLEKEYDTHSNLPMVAVYPGFDSIRHDPRFQRILDRIGLPQP